jgi:peroxiredoxin
MRIAITFALLAVAVAVMLAAAADTTKPAEPVKAPAKPAATAVELTPGQPVPDFTLSDATGKSYNLQQLVNDGNVVVLEWFNYGCPFVLKYRSPSTFMNDAASSFNGKKVVWLAICSSAPGKQGGDRDEAAKFAAANGMTVPILWDQDGKVGKAFGARTTPHMYVVGGKSRKLFYVGAPDTSTQMDREPKDNLIAPAVLAAMKGEMPKVTSTPPHGCSVKYAD